jgi:AcrR family transcriptional regulator
MLLLYVTVRFDWTNCLVKGRLPRMSPRAYSMTKRRSTVEATRRGIVEAAARLHSRQGAVRTTWDDIAAEAGVSRATVYHHFPSLADLIPACAQLAFEVADIPTAQEATARFAALPDPAARLARLIDDTCACYAAGAFWLRAAWRERDLVPEMGVAVRRLQRAMRILLDAATLGLELEPESRVVLVTLVDFPFWDALRSSGMPERAAADRIRFLAQVVIRDGGRRR